MKCPTQKNHLNLILTILNLVQRDLLLVFLLVLYRTFYWISYRAYSYMSLSISRDLYLPFIISYINTHGFKPHLFYFLLISYCGLPFSWVLFCSLHECSFICVCLKWAGSQMNHHTCRGSLCLCFSFYWL